MKRRSESGLGNVVNVMVLYSLKGFLKWFYGCLPHRPLRQGEPTGHVRHAEEERQDIH